MRKRGRPSSTRPFLTSSALAMSTLSLAGGMRFEATSSVAAVSSGRCTCRRHHSVRTGRIVDANQPGRVAHHHPARGDIVENEGERGDPGMIADVDGSNDDAAGAEFHAVTHTCDTLF